MQWPATIGDDAAREIGVVVAHDVNNGKTRAIWGMGRHNHENSVAFERYGYPVVLSGDDTFVTSPNQSQIYSYIARTRTQSGTTPASCGRSSRTTLPSMTTTTSTT